MSNQSSKLGISGNIAKAFQANAITPLLGIIALLFGLFAVIMTPKEEDPQIDVTFADVFIPYVGATPEQVAQQVTIPAEKIISQIKGVDTLYSFSQPDGALIITIFDVGVPRDEAVVNIYNQLYSNKDKFNSAAGIGDPLIKPKGIEDVPIVSLTLHSTSPDVTPQDLTHVATRLETELKRIPGTRDITQHGQQQLIIDVRIDPSKLAFYGLTFDDIAHQLSQQNKASGLTSLVQNNQEVKVRTGEFFTSVEDVSNLVVKVFPTKINASVVYLGDIATVTLSSETPTQWVRHIDKNGSYSAVTLAMGKQTGKNAVDIADKIIQRVDSLKNVLIPDNIEVSVTRNYGETASDKASTLIYKLVFATAAVVFLVLITMGLRESAVVGVAIIITLALTLFASWAWGFTLNRISLFALIFSIGILVDDAIVVVENIHRHMALSDKPLLSIIPKAVDEVGSPTILATLTVIAALLPMAFVSGLMGPYMSPIPINASMGMLLSLGIAFVMTPYLAQKWLKRHHVNVEEDQSSASQSQLSLFFTKLLSPFINGASPKKARFSLGLAIIILIGVAISLPAMHGVILKMLPFDNKSEFQIMVDLPEGATLETTERLLQEMSTYLIQRDEVKDVQTYAGTSAPINFNGLVRHYFLRQSPSLGDIQVNLVDKSIRSQDSHSIALSVREKLNQIAAPYHADVKVVEVPPGPPVWSPIVAEVYAPTQDLREQVAKQLKQEFEQTAHVVDIDIYSPYEQKQWQIHIDRSKAQHLGLSYSAVVNAIATAINGKDVSYIQREGQIKPTPIRLQFNDEDKLNLHQVLAQQLINAQGESISLSQVASIIDDTINPAIVHKNGVPMIMVVADMAGPTDSPLYGMFEIVSNINQTNLGLAPPIAQHFIEQGDGLADVSILWDGEWKITYETFRDMGIAYAVGMIAIYLLVVAQFKSYLIPLIIMAPIPLTIIGVMPGHALLGAQFTATSMIGMIALAGIIVRNSILLVDFIMVQQQQGVSLDEAVIQAAAVRAKPIMLTALAAMIGALFILDDPIFNGLAISLIFGIFVSTLLTLIIIPVLYFSLMQKRSTSHVDH